MAKNTSQLVQELQEMIEIKRGIKGGEKPSDAQITKVSNQLLRSMKIDAREATYYRQLIEKARSRKQQEREALTDTGRKMFARERVKAAVQKAKTAKELQAVIDQAIENAETDRDLAEAFIEFGPADVLSLKHDSGGTRQWTWLGEVLQGYTIPLDEDEQGLVEIENQISGDIDRLLANVYTAENVLSRHAPELAMQFEGQFNQYFKRENADFSGGTKITFLQEIDNSPTGERERGELIDQILEQRESLLSTLAFDNNITGSSAGFERMRNNAQTLEKLDASLAEMGVDIPSAQET